MQVTSTKKLFFSYAYPLHKEFQHKKNSLLFRLLVIDTDRVNSWKCWCLSWEI